MAGKKYSAHQRKIIQNYYRNLDAIQTQRLAEIVTEIYLATTARRKDQLWTRATKIVDAIAKEKPDDRAMLERILEDRDIEALAELAGQRF